MAKPKLGSGKRFAAIEAKAGDARNPAAVAAAVGRKKWGSKMAIWAAAARRKMKRR